jgi:hypothetical protein
VGQEIYREIAVLLAGVPINLSGCNVFVHPYIHREPFVSSVGQKSVPARPLSWSPRLVIRRYGVYCSLALLLLIALVVRPEVYRPESLFLILRSASQLGMVALGQTLVMLVAGLDLSVTGVLVLTSVVIAQVGAGHKQPDFARASDLACLWRIDRPGERAADHQAQRPAVCGDARHAGAHSRRAERLHPGHPQRPGPERSESAQSVARTAAGLVRHLDGFHRAAGVRPVHDAILVAGSTPSAATARRLGCRALRSTAT